MGIRKSSKTDYLSQLRLVVLCQYDGDESKAPRDFVETLSKRILQRIYVSKIELLALAGDATESDLVWRDIKSSDVRIESLLIQANRELSDQTLLYEIDAVFMTQLGREVQPSPTWAAIYMVDKKHADREFRDIPEVVTALREALIVPDGKCAACLVSGSALMRDSGSNARENIYATSAEDWSQMEIERISAEVMTFLPRHFLRRAYFGPFRYEDGVSEPFAENGQSTIDSNPQPSGKCTNRAVARAALHNESAAPVQDRISRCEESREVHAGDRGAVLCPATENPAVIDSSGQYPPINVPLERKALDWAVRRNLKIVAPWGSLPKSTPAEGSTAVSAIGFNHLEKQSPCQDASAVIQVANGTYISVVADGLGSSSRSEQGSQCAVESTLLYLGSAFSLDSAEKEFLTDSGCKVVMALAAEYARERVTLLARTESNPLSDYFTTLAICVVGQGWVSAVAIGDAFVVLRRAGAEEFETLIDLGKNGIDPENYTATLLDRNLDLRYGHAIGDVDFLMLSTDGLAPIFFEDGVSIPRNEFVRYFESNTRKVRGDSGAMQRFLLSDWVNKRTTDDKTAALIWKTSKVE